MGAGEISAFIFYLTFRERVNARGNKEIEVREKNNLKHGAVLCFLSGLQIAENAKVSSEKRFSGVKTIKSNRTSPPPKTPKRCLFGQRPKVCLWLL